MMEDYMEHRCSVRLPVEMDILLYHNNVPVVHCKTHNIGADGMFLNSGPLKYQTNTMLKVEFQDRKGSEQHSYMLSAMVVHHANNGLGLMFPGGDSDSMRVWHDLIRNKVIQKYSLSRKSSTSYTSDLKITTLDEKDSIDNIIKFEASA